ncbi:MAG: sigma factor-like helix-turn-helix DNA-binding protein, partial [Betaproteobacteria bacterium]
PCEEIAAVLGLSVGATRTRLSRARLALHALMREAADPSATPDDKENKPALRLVQSRGVR